MFKVLLTEELIDRVRERGRFKCVFRVVVRAPRGVDGGVPRTEEREDAQLLRLWHRESIQQGVFCQRKDDRVRTYAECKRADGDRSEAGAAAEHPHGIAQIGVELVEETQTKRGADVVLMCFEGSEFEARSAGGFPCRETFAFEVCSASFKVECEFVGELSFALIAMQERAFERAKAREDGHG